MSGRTVYEVVNDPSNADLRSEAEAKFAAAEVAPTIAESFDLFAAGMALLRKLDDRERAREFL